MCMYVLNRCGSLKIVVDNEVKGLNVYLIYTRVHIWMYSDAFTTWNTKLLQLSLSPC